MASGPELRRTPTVAGTGPVAPQASPAELGVVAGRYKLLGRIAEGGMGVVYKAEHTLSRKKLAIKILHPHLSHGKQAVERFKREVSAAADIDHPGIVQVFDAGMDTDGSFYMAMELLDGESLAGRMRRHWPGMRTAVGLVIGMCDPLAKAHGKNFVHRDLKPDNTFLARDPEGRERVKILDFGLVREVSRSGPTMSGITFGTPEYMAPEQAMSAKRAGIQADVWSLGVILYELLAGRHPFTGETPNAIMANAIKDPHPPLAEIAPHVPKELAAIVESCLAKDPAARPPDAGALGRALTELTAGVELEDRPPENPVIRASDSASSDGGSLDLPIVSAAIPIERGPTLYVSSRRARWPWIAGSIAGVLLLVAIAFFALQSPAPAPAMVATPIPAPAPVAAVPAPVAPLPVAEEPPPVVEPAPEPSAAIEPDLHAERGPAARSRPGRPGRADPGAPVAETAAEETGGGHIAEARACLERGDTRCAVAALGQGSSAAELALLVEVFHAQGRASEARAAMERYVSRFPRGPAAAGFRRQLDLTGP